MPIDLIEIALFLLAFLFFMIHMLNKYVDVNKSTQIPATLEHFTEPNPKHINADIGGCRIHCINCGREHAFHSAVNARIAAAVIEEFVAIHNDCVFQEDEA